MAPKISFKLDGNWRTSPLNLYQFLFEDVPHSKHLQSLRAGKLRLKIMEQRKSLEQKCSLVQDPPLQFSVVQCTAVYSLHYTALHCTAMYCTAQHCIKCKIPGFKTTMCQNIESAPVVGQVSATLQYTTLYYTSLHYTTLDRDNMGQDA